MNPPVNERFFEYLGLKTSARHKYLDKAELEEIHNRTDVSINFVREFLYRYPAMTLTLLDVGCGDGYAMARFIQMKHPVGHRFDVFGVDPAIIKEELVNPDLALRMTNGTFETLTKQFTETKFDVVFANHSLEHSPNVYLSIWNIKRIMSMQGILFIACPDFRSEWGSSLLTSQSHFSCITPHFLDTCLKRYGFETIITIQGTEDRPEIFCIAINKTRIEDL